MQFIPWVRKIPGDGNGNPLQYSCLQSPMDRGAWQATVLGIMKMLACLTVAFNGKVYNIIASSMVPEVGFFVCLFFFLRSLFS